MTADREQIKQFLLELKMALSRDGNLHVADREKNVKSLAIMGMLPNEVSQVLRSLKVSDYSEGPLDDDQGRPIQWWVFGPNYCGTTLYVKVALRHNRVICLSFHKPEHELAHPYREEVQR